MLNTESLLEIKNISQRYDALHVVQDLSLHLPPGGIGCLLGPSGCGKTTVLRCIAGFERIQNGEIRIAGEVVSSGQFHLPAERRRIGMVFQDYALFPHLTVAKNIEFGLHNLARSERTARVNEMLELVGLSNALKLYPHELSGGQQQRIALARAVAPRPRLLLLDEPFSNLDVDLRQRLCIEVRDILKHEHVTALLVTHDQLEAFMIADEIGVMNDGVIQQWDTGYNLYHRPINRFVADFVGQGAFVRGRVLDEHRIEIELGVIEGEFKASIPAGSAVAVLLRPDDLVHDDHSALRARVSAKAFRGASILYTLCLPSGAEVLSLVPSHHDHDLGEDIGVMLATDHVIAFPV